MLTALTLDQIQILLAVAEEGSFSGAARRLGRAQSAVTYGVQKLESQLGMELFDRSRYRPALTAAGRALMPRARRIVEEATGFRDQARGLARGLESELAMVVDSMFPMPPIVEALRAFTARFPTVPPRIYVQSLGASAELVLNGTCVLGLMPARFSEAAALRRIPLLTVELLPVVSREHPLARMKGLISAEVLRRQVQLVLTDRSTVTAGRDYGVLSAQTWRLADLGTKHAMLLAGLGWGSMPAHLVAEDVRQGRLQVIQPAEFGDPEIELVMAAAYLSGRVLGPAAQWMLDHLVQAMVGDQDSRSMVAPQAASLRSIDS